MRCENVGSEEMRCSRTVERSLVRPTTYGFAGLEEDTPHLAVPSRAKARSHDGSRHAEGMAGLVHHGDKDSCLVRAERDLGSIRSDIVDQIGRCSEGGRTAEELTAPGIYIVTRCCMMCDATRWPFSRKASSHQRASTRQSDKPIRRQDAACRNDRRSHKP